MILLTVTGRKGGKAIATPINYLRDGHTLWVISWRDRTWWRNLRGSALVNVLLAGKAVQGCGQVIEEPKAVAQSLFACYQKVPKYAKYVQICLDNLGCPIFADCERAAQNMVMIRIEV